MKIKSVCIVGGGTAGWVAALSILKKLPEVTVTLVESPTVPTVGVGEATQPGVLRYFRDHLGLQDEDWMGVSDGTFKSGGNFTNFNSLDPDDTVTHALVTPGESKFSNVYNWGVKKTLQDVPNTDYARTFYHAPYMHDQNKFGDLGDCDWHAFQFDATKFAGYAKQASLEKGMRYIQDTVTDVNVVDGNIVAVQTEGNGLIESDFFFDCSGFKALLINGALGDKFVDATDVLPNNNAIATKIEYVNRAEELTPVTGATALTNGWVWNISLWSRVGTGYVYSDKFTDRDSAEKEFREHLATKFGADRAANAEMQHLKMRIGHQTNPWKNNCLSLGLSSHFVEPLESTGLTFVTTALTKFTELVTANNLNHNELMRIRYNTHIIGLFNEAKDFVLMHYLNTKRTDSDYWRSMQHMVPPQSIVSYFSQLDSSWRWQPAEGNDKLFNDMSWVQIVVGFNFIDMRNNLNINNKPLDNDTLISEAKDINAIAEALRKRRESIETNVGRMVSLEQYMLDFYKTKS